MVDRAQAVIFEEYQVVPARDRCAPPLVIDAPGVLNLEDAALHAMLDQCPRLRCGTLFLGIKEDRQGLGLIEGS